MSENILVISLQNLIWPISYYIYIYNIYLYIIYKNITIAGAFPKSDYEMSQRVQMTGTVPFNDKYLKGVTEMIYTIIFGLLPAKITICKVSP